MIINVEYLIRVIPLFMMLFNILLLFIVIFANKDGTVVSCAFNISRSVNIFVFTAFIFMNIYLVF